MEIKHNIECGGTLRKVLSFDRKVQTVTYIGYERITIWQCERCLKVESTKRDLPTGNWTE